MKPNKDVERLADHAERHRRCFYPLTNAEQKAVSARYRSGELVRPHRHVYARPDYWNSLDPDEQSRHLVKTLSRQYPHRVFAGPSAAATLHLDGPWALHRDNLIFVATTGSTYSKRMHPKLRLIGMADVPAHVVRHYRDTCGRMRCDVAPVAECDVENVTCDAGLRNVRPATEDDGARLVMRDAGFGMGYGYALTDMVRVTSPARTLVDCGLRYPFEQVLPMVDTALRRGLTSRDDVLAICDAMYEDCGDVLRLLHYADPLSENGGESLCRAAIIEEGFVLPQLQRPFVDPANGRDEYRADFTWCLPGGRIVVLEYDGMRKYVDPAMTDRRDVRGVVERERARETALRAAGVTTILRVSHAEVTERTPLILKLQRAGIPRVSSSS